MGLFSKYMKPLLRQMQNRFDTPAIVLLYHRVKDLETDYQQLAVSPWHFEEQVAYLKSSYNLIGAEEFAGHLKSKTTFKPRTVLITFDDGYADNLEHAIPVLEKNNAEALFYITTSKLNTDDSFWWDELEHVFRLPHLPDVLKITIRERDHIFRDIDSNRMAIYDELHLLIKYTHYKERDALMDRIREWSGAAVIPQGQNRLLTHHELAKMSRSASCTIGAHTHDHPVLKELNREEQYKQISTSKEILEKLSEKPVKHFSYPFGTSHDYDRNSVEVCRELGFEMVSSNYHWQVHKYTSRFEVPRMLVRDWDIQTFREKIDSFFIH